jgi:hypothetical protein
MSNKGFNMKRYMTVFVLAFMMFGCSSKNMTVASVTQEFWTAQKQNQIEAAKRLTVKEDEKKTKLYEKIKIKTAIFGDVKEENNKATVPTKLYLKGDKDVSEVEFETTLNKTDKGWRVNMDSTKRSLYFAISKQVAGNLGNIFKKNFDGVDNIKKIFGEFIKNFKDVVEKNGVK